MKTISDPALFKTIKSFTTVYLPKVRSRSPHTIQAYKDSINGFILFLKCKNGIELCKVKTEHFNRDNIMAYLEWLKSDRGNSDTTINQRLMSIRSFLNYLAGENAVGFETYSQVKQIKKIPTPDRFISDILSVDDVKFLLELPDISKKTNLRDRFYMALLYDTGCRNQEILDLKIGDIQINRVAAHVNIIKGKGAKSRVTPLSNEIISMFEQYVVLYHPDRNPQNFLFYTERNKIVTQMSPDNTARFLNVYEEKAKIKRPDFPHLHPHLFRHTRAMHLYQAGMPLPLIGQWLGHSNQETTLIYAYADIEMKRKAIDKMANSENAVFTDDIFKYQDDDAVIRKLYGLD